MINVIFALVLALSMASGCVTKKECLRQGTQMAIDARNQALKDCSRVTEEYQERLRKFNQLNDDGSLR